MERESQLSLLAAQIECAKSKMRHARESGSVASTIERIVGSLRLTLACVLSGQDPSRVGLQGFVLEAGTDGEYTVKWCGEPVPVSGPYLEAILHLTGVQPAPLQVLLLEVGLVRDLVEEALGRIAHDQAQVARERAALEAILRRFPELHTESLGSASRSAECKAEDVRRRKVALLSASLKIGEHREPEGRPERAA